MVVPHFAGMFVAITATTALWTQAQWDADADAMRAAGFRFMVVPHTGRQLAGPTPTCPQGTFETYWPVAPTAFNGTADCFTQVGDLEAEGGTLGNIFRAAAHANLSEGVHVGLMFAPAEHGFPSQHRNGSYLNWGSFQAEVVTYLGPLYAGSAGAPVAGFYTEIEFSNDLAWIDALPDFGRDYLGPIVRAGGALGAQVWASPYSIGNLTRHPRGFVSPAAYGKGMRSAFDAAAAAAAPSKFHHVAMQDSMGAQGNSFENASDFLGNMSAQVPAWANVEIFEVWPQSCQWPDPCHGRHPAPWDRIVKQMANEAAQLGGPASATLIAWEWYSCFSPNAVGDPHHPFPQEAKANYEAYMAYLRQGQQ